MKGFVLTLRNGKNDLRAPDLRGIGKRVKAFITGYGLQSVFALLFLFGLIVGVACSASFDEDTFKRLDLLFTTNIGARADMNVPDIFISCFVSYFLFVFCAFLSGISLWGFAAVPLLSAFRGFCVGLSSAFVFSVYRLSGVGFYILVILPGTILFLLAYIRYSAHAFRLSLRYAGASLWGADREPELRAYLKHFLKRTLFTLLAVTACAVTDLVLWILFADKFQF